jgi:predicted nucleotidyltransferase component of viral defense system
MAKDLGASVRARLLNHARLNDQPFDLILIRFALERFLYRLSQSAHAERFILKGAMLLATWFDDPMRPTRDLDLLGFGDCDSDAILATFRDIVAVEVEDGIFFDPDALKIVRIRNALDYGGVRIQTTARISGAHIPVSIDVGFGDALAPGVEELSYPVLLDLPVPKLRAYARETVIAEKFQAMVVLGRANTRMKDFYDIWLLSQAFEYDQERLVAAITATFARRETALPVELPDALTSDFASDPTKVAQWVAFKRDLATDPGSLQDVIPTIADFLMRHARDAADRANKVP